MLPDLVYTDQSNTFLQNQILQGSLLMGATGTATGTQNFSSNPFDLQASFFDGSKPQLQTFRWLAEPNPSGDILNRATLNLLFSRNGSPFLETGVSFVPNGTLNLASLSSVSDLIVSPTKNLILQSPAITYTNTGSDLSQFIGRDWMVSAGREVQFGGNDFTIGAANNLVFSSGKDMSVSVGGSTSLTSAVGLAFNAQNMALTSSGGYQLTAGSAGTESFGSSLTTTVGSSLSESVGADANIKAAGNLTLRSGKVSSYLSDQDMTLESKSGIALKASTDVVMRAGASITLQSGLPIQLQGDVNVTGNLSKGGGSFKIDHPLDPANKYLYHSFVESPDMMDVYNGNVTTDRHGIATITLPSYFQALNRDFRYQLTVLGQFAQAIVLSEVRDNCFTIKTNKGSVRVSWQVTGIRQDAFANAHRIPVEADKPLTEQGHYLHPELFHARPELAIGSRPAQPTQTNENAGSR